MLGLLLATWAGASEPEVLPASPPTAKAKVKVGGHLKTFGLVSLGRPVDGLPDDLLHNALNPFPDGASGQGILDGRLNLSVDVGQVLRLEAAHAITVFLDGDGTADRSNAAVVAALQDDPFGALGQLTQLSQVIDGTSANGGGGSAAFSTGVGRAAPEAFPLTWRAGNDPAKDVQVLGRTDRLLARLSFEGFDVVVGRQPISFGSGLFFTPLDLVSPFTPATIDSEYKPGVDAVRLDGYFGMAGSITVVAAYTGQTHVYEDPGEGESTAERVTVAALGRVTVGTTDLSLFLGGVRGDLVAGLSVVGGAGPVGLHGDIAVTVPRTDMDEPVFVRAVLGADGRPSPTTTLSGELYVQSFGSSDPSSLFGTLSGERSLRGEVWLAGIAYAGIAVSQEITPLWMFNLGTFVNLTDPSALFAPSLSWSAAQNVDLALGGYVGIGRPATGRELDVDALPENPDLEDLAVVVPQSEFGSYPANLFAKVAVYF